MKDIYVEYYLNLIKNKKGVISYGVEGNHDCIVIDFDSTTLKFNEKEFFSSIVLFHEYNDDDISVKENPINEGYTYTNEGFGEGVYFNKQVNSELFYECLKYLSNNSLN